MRQAQAAIGQMSRAGQHLLTAAGDASDDGGDSLPQSGPDVVVTLGQGASPPVTYDASGRFGGAAPAEADDALDGTEDDGSAPPPDATDQDSAVAA